MYQMCRASTARSSVSHCGRNAFKRQHSADSEVAVVGIHSIAGARSDLLVRIAELIGERRRRLAWIAMFMARKPQMIDQVS